MRRGRRESASRAVTPCADKSAPQPIPGTSPYDLKDFRMNAAAWSEMHQTTRQSCSGFSPAGQRHVAARDIRPGDHLPPQPALHGTRYQQDGFTVGADDRDVVAGTPALPGRMLLFGPAGTLDSVTPDTHVTVRRHEADTEQHHNPR